ncbi:hypothetical protein SAMN04489712_105453 [Thermomonospora echinospora]|uniref:Uncharacterized protein n=1 Tax=Thermomonospora echinospora TaxID=1992 RepID=A0A1H6AGX9_9ACTN|nr:hypothetical protein [Thermomonospora echinospora]SEG48029.1 hypothetical protein SAMN04489712_105453 [Thermomonospora echinospora]
MAQDVHNPVVAAFVAQLREFHLACGAPAYRSLVDVSGRLADLYPEQVRERNLPKLSVSAISEVLGGRRAGLPSAGWVVSFVLACQRRAFETFVISADPGVDTVPTWIERLQQARTALAPECAASGEQPAAGERPAPYEPAQREGEADTIPDATGVPPQAAPADVLDTSADPAAGASAAADPAAGASNDAGHDDGGVIRR